MTTDPFTDAARAEGFAQWPMRDQRSAFEHGARWARAHLAAARAARRDEEKR